MKAHFLFLTLAIAPVLADESAENLERIRIGTAVLELRAALEAPEDPESLETIVRHGTDTRDYAMIRGWLVQLRAGVRSQIESASDAETLDRHRRKEAFLAKAIRRIDLE